MKQDWRNFCAPEYMVLRRNLKAYRSKHKLSQAELAKMIGTTNRSLSRWEVGTTMPSVCMIVRLCDIFKLTIDEFCTIPYFGGSKAPHVRELDLLDEIRCFDEEEVDVLKSVVKTELEYTARAEKYKGRTIKDLQVLTMPARSYEEYDFSEEIPPEWISVVETPENKNAYIVVKVTNDEMIPTYKPGQLLYLEKADEIKKGEIGVFVINAFPYLKEMGDNQLLAHNKDYHYMNISEKVHSSKIVGRVIGIVNNEHRLRSPHFTVQYNKRK